MSRSLPAADAGGPQSSSEAIAERIRAVMLTESLRPGDRLGRRRISPAILASAGQRSAKR